MTFHKSAVLVIPLVILASTRRRLWTAIWAGAAGLVLFLVFLAEHTQRFWSAYVESDYAFASEGGPIRVAMNAVLAIMFLLLYKRMAMSREERAL